MTFAENNINVEAPKNRSFRLETNAAYLAVKGKNMKEMDVGWVDDAASEVWLVELKDYGAKSPGVFAAAQSKLEDTLPDKLRDTLAMLGAGWAKTPWGQWLVQEIETTCPAFPESAVPIRAAAVINIQNPADRHLVLNLKEVIRNRLDGELDVMDVQTVIVVPLGHSATKSWDAVISEIT